jgi:integrase
LVNLKWADVGPSSISLVTSKSGGTIRATVPLLADARAAIAEIASERERQTKHGHVPSSFLLVSHLGTPWKPDGVTQAFLRAAKKAGVHKRLHDLRGTAATRFVVEFEASDEEIADIMGWEQGGVARIRKRYVDGDRIAKGIVARVEKRAQTG